MRKLKFLLILKLNIINKMVNKHELSLNYMANETIVNLFLKINIKIIKAFAIDANFNFNILKNYLSCDFCLTIMENYRGVMVYPLI